MRAALARYAHLRRHASALPFVCALAFSLSCGNASNVSPPSSTPLPSVTPTAARTVIASGVPSATVPSGTVMVQLAEHFFSPSLVTVKVGTTVVWVDVGQQSHDVHARDGSFNSPPLGPGNTFTYTFTKPGKYPYYCVPHEGDGMFGEVDVVE